MRKSQKPVSSNLTYFPVYKARVIDNHDPLKLGRILVTIPDLDTDKPMWVLPLLNSPGEFKIPDINQVVLIISDLESPGVYYYYGVLTEYTPTPKNLVNDEHSAVIPVVIENKFDYDSSDNQNRYFIQYHSIYSDELWYRIPQDKSYYDYTSNQFIKTKDQKLTEAKITRIKNSLIEFKSDNDTSTYSFYLLPPASNDLYTEETTNIYSDKSADRKTGNYYYQTSYKKSEYKKYIKVVDLDKSTVDTTEYRSIYFEDLNVEIDQIYQNKTREVLIGSDPNKSRLIKWEYLLNNDRVCLDETYSRETNTIYKTTCVNQNEAVVNLEQVFGVNVNAQNLTLSNNQSIFYHHQNFDLNDIRITGTVDNTSSRLLISVTTPSNTISININAQTGEITIDTTNKLIINAANSVEINSPLTQINGNVEISGTLNVNGLSTLAGNVTTTGTHHVNIDRFVDIYNSHTHNVIAHSNTTQPTPNAP